MDQVHQHDLPPSTVLSYDEVTQVLGNLFQLHDLRDYNGITNHIKTKCQPHVKEQAEPSEIQAAEI